MDLFSAEIDTAFFDRIKPKKPAKAQFASTTLLLEASN